MVLCLFRASIGLRFFPLGLYSSEGLQSFFVFVLFFLKDIFKA